LPSRTAGTASGLPADQSRIVSSGALLVWVDVALAVLAAAVVIALAAVALRFGR
jgi:hypothetical protein